ncbi:MAG: thioredoxin family protein [Candidatus Thorarchaeota archaeon]
MAENAEWDTAITYKNFLKKAREHVELMKARYNDLQLNEIDLETLGSIQNDIRILVIGTDRCSDSAGTIPILARIEAASPKIELRVLDSDANARYHQQFRVNGKRKTPVVLFLSQDHEELCRWVERPNAAYKVINEGTINAADDQRDGLTKLYSDPEIQRQALNEFISLVLRSDFILGRK